MRVKIGKVKCDPADSDHPNIPMHNICSMRSQTLVFVLYACISTWGNEMSEILDIFYYDNTYE